MISRHSIRTKLTATVAMVASALALAFVASAYAWFRDVQAETYEGFALHEIDEIAETLAGATTLDEEHRAGLERLLPEEGVVSLGIWSLSGELVHRVPAAGPEPEPWPEGVAQALDGRPAFQALDAEDGPRRLHAARLLDLGGEPRWIATSTVSLAAADEALTGFLTWSIGGLVAAVLLLVFGSFVLLTHALRPFRELVQEAVDLAKDPNGELLEPPLPGSELATLSILLNDMLRETRETHARLRRFSSDASHELRTPLTRIRGEIETALTAGDLAASRAALASTIEEVDSLSRVIDALLDLAQGETPTPSGLPRIDIATLAVEVAREAEPVGLDQGVRVELLEARARWVRGSRPLLSRVLWNLIDNAVRAARPGGRVELRLVDLDGDRVGIDVEDDGPGLEASGDPERLFEPFIRGSLSSEDPGHGLGLALSRAIARRHGGDLQWGVSEKLGGARLRLILPTWSAAPR